MNVTLPLQRPLEKRYLTQRRCAEQQLASHRIRWELRESRIGMRWVFPYLADGVPTARVVKTDCPVVVSARLCRTKFSRPRRPFVRHAVNELTATGCGVQPRRVIPLAHGVRRHIVEVIGSVALQ